MSAAERAGLRSRRGAGHVFSSSNCRNVLRTGSRGEEIEQREEEMIHSGHSQNVGILETKEEMYMYTGGSSVADLSPAECSLWEMVRGWQTGTESRASIT